MSSSDYNTKEEKLAHAKGFIEGMRQGIELYAWWKDGVQYVGCGIKTLRDALDNVAKEYKNTMEDF